jgi:glycosyltransferase involved in cell wall biosynthesis
VRAYPYVVSPRGMLEPAALRHHRLRKQLAYQCCDSAILAGAACWHATSPGETATLTARPGARPVAEIPNSVEPLPADADARAAARAAVGLSDGRPFVMFLGRLHPIKRLDLLADAFSSIAPEFPTLDLVIAGPDEGGHRARIAPALRCRRQPGALAGRRGRQR